MPRSFQNGGEDFNEPAIYLSQQYIPNNVTLKKRTVCILRPVPAFSWALVINGEAYQLMSKIIQKIATEYELR